MSSMDFSDPQISIAHDALLHNAPTRWFLLEYGHGPHVLVLSASGTGDVDELRTHLKNNVCYGVFREQTQNNKFLRISINYIPDSVKGVWRARALVHVTAVAAKFKVHEVLTISTSDQLSVRELRSTLNLPPRVPQGSPAARLPGSKDSSKINSIPRKPPPDTTSVSMTSSPPRTHSPSPTNEFYFQPSSQQLASSLSTKKQNAVTAVDTDISSPPIASGPLPSISSNPIGSLLTKISTAGSPSPSTKSSQLQSLPVTSSVINRSINDSRVPHARLSPQTASWFAKQEFPLPPPPESKNENHLQDVEQSSVNSDGLSQIGSIPDSNSVASLHDSSPSPPLPSSIVRHSVNSSVSTRHSKEVPRQSIDGLPPSSLTSIPTAQPTASRPAISEDLNNHTVTNREVAVDPRLFSAPKRHLSRFQARASSPAEAEEERKLVVLEEERRRRALERARREKEIREEEEARQREFEERKEREKKRRLENARKSEERRVERKRQQEEEEARRKAEKERKDAEVRERRNRIKRRFEKQSGVNLLSGFITLESSGNWKRRYYRLSTEDWIFFKNDEDTTIPINALELSRIQALREWTEGYEELEAIPYSFAVEFKDNAPCLFFADSAEDKEILMGLLNQAAGL